MKKELEILLDKTEYQKSVKLDLGKFELKSIPDRVFKFHWLEELSFGKYYDFSQAEWVNEGQCMLEYLPEELLQLESLNTLILSGGPFGYSKPDLVDFEIVWQLTNLKKLVLDSTHISNIDGLRSLSNIEYLGLSNTDVKDFTPISEATKLETLLMSGNDIESIQFLNGLELLKNISLSSNKLTNLNGLENKQQLKRLCICENKLTNLDQLYSTKNIEYLCLRGCDRITRGEIAQHLPLLEFYSLSGIPELDEIANNIKLKEITLQGVTNLGLIELQKFTKCEELSIYGSFEELTPLCELKKLKSLTLISHKLKSLGNFELPDLTFLSINSGSLINLSGIENFKKLESIELEDLPIEKLDNIKNLDRLSTLSLTNTEVSSLKPILEQLEKEDNFNLTWYQNKLPIELDDIYSESGLKGIIKFYKNEKT